MVLKAGSMLILRTGRHGTGLIKDILFKGMGPSMRASRGASLAASIIRMGLGKTGMLMGRKESAKRRPEGPLVSEASKELETTLAPRFWSPQTKRGKRRAEPKGLNTTPP